ncbi:MAG: hypothetical protein H7268_05545 [Sandarakinorhabdus sp.]|nr:hypothetical protein [Sandarakinorhabdus sp.]
MADKPKIISTVKARGGVTPHIVRYVLMISLVLAVAAMVFAYARAPTATQDGPTSVAGPQ